MQLRSEFNLGEFNIRVNWLVVACVLMTAFGFSQLGLWQLSRAAEKVESQRAIELELRDSAPPVEDIPAEHLHPANPEMQNRHVTLTGEYDNEHSMLLLAEFFEGQIGYGVVTPLRLASNGKLVLVNRGWTTGILPANTPPDLRPVTGPVTLTAQVYVPPENAREFDNEIDHSVWPLRLRTINFDVLTEILGEPLFPFELRLTANQAGTLVRHWPAVNPDVNQNLSYAVQWFGFALLVIFASILASSNLWALLRGPKP